MPIPGLGLMESSSLKPFTRGKGGDLFINEIAQSSDFPIEGGKAETHIGDNHISSRRLLRRDVPINDLWLDEPGCRFTVKLPYRGNANAEPIEHRPKTRPSTAVLRASRFRRSL